MQAISNIYSRRLQKITATPESALRGQNLDFQMESLAASVCAEVLTDLAISGTQARRRGLDEIPAKVQRRDENVVWNVGRLGGNAWNLLALLDELETSGI
uniref:recombinase family protein n=1 Tax=Arthrobacter sp. TaxID=1667 RepID=UPI0020D1F550|nr:recombinase family protein [Arthrobacter sp.]